MIATGFFMFVVLLFFFWFEEYGNFIFMLSFCQMENYPECSFRMGYGKKYLMFHIKKNM